MLVGAWCLNGVTRIRVLVKVREVDIVGKLWYPWGLYLLLLHHVPIDATEPTMLLEVLCATFHATKTFSYILLQQTRHKLSCVDAELSGELEISNRDFSVHFIRVLVVKRRVASKHLEYQNSKCPPVN